jgi:hypothetical protein
MREEHYILKNLLDIRSEIDLSGLVQGPVFANPTVPPTYNPVLPPDGNRTPAEKSPYNYRGYIPSLCDTRTMPIESDVERHAAHIFQADRNVVELRAQWPTRIYLAADGTYHDHTFDFWIRLKNRERVAVAVKPFKKIVEVNLIDTLKRIRRAGTADFADRITWVDESFATPDADANARWILLSRRSRNEAEYQIAKRLIEGMSGSVRFWDLVRIAPVHAYRRTAVWNLIDDGLLHAVLPGRITDASLLTTEN